MPRAVMKDGENGKNINKTRHQVPKTRLTAFLCPSLGSACRSTRRCLRKAHSQSANLRRKTWWTGQRAGRATPHALRRRCHPNADRPPIVVLALALCFPSGQDDVASVAAIVGVGARPLAAH